MNKTATLAGGCFWCTEAIFQRLRGVASVTPGFTGGNTLHPTYEQVLATNTGHAEAIQIIFDPQLISYATLLTVFFHLHDPTTKNKQGNDIGSQYRSVIFYHDDTQRQTAEAVIKQITDEKLYSKPIITEISPFTVFYPAEEYHHNFYAKNSSAPYCQYIIDPKIQRLLTEYKPLIKPEFIQ